MFKKFKSREKSKQKLSKKKYFVEIKIINQRLSNIVACKI